MMRGMGIDISLISRFEGRSERFYGKILSDEEMSQPLTAEYVSSRFSAKEAFSKAIGTGIRGFSMRDITVSEDDSGRPYFIFKGNAEELTRGMKFHLSISHDAGISVAVVVAEDEN